MHASRARVIVSLTVIVVSLTIFAAAGYLLDRRIIRLLDARLGETLVGHARTIATDIVPPPADDAFSLALVIAELTDARLASDAQVVVLLDNTGSIVAADPPGLQSQAYLRLDNAALASALTGSAASGERYSVGGQDLKSAFAPITDSYGDITGAIGVEAPADFFGALREVRAALLTTLAVGMVLIVALTGVVWRFWARSERSERAMFRTQQLATIGQMTATMAHEVRNPLSIIRATAERIRRRYGDGDELFDFIPDEVDRLDRVTRWYLDFARPSELDRRPVDLRAVVEESVERLRKNLEQGRIDVRIDSPRALTVVADRDRLVQAVLNVLINATEAMTGGGEVDVRIATRGESVRLEIADTGPGLPSDLGDRAFEPFATTKAKGSGLGLAVVRQVAEDLGGAAGVESADTGTTIWMELPAAP